VWFIVAGVVGLGALGLGWLAFTDQRALWQRFEAWRYRSPEANEPSDAAYAGRRVGLAVLAVLVGMCAVGLWRAADTLSWSGGEVRDAAEDAASALGDDGPVLVGPVTFDSFEPYLEDALRHTSAAEDNASLLSISRERVAEDGEDGGDDEVSWRGRVFHEGDETVEHYTVSADGEHPVCVTITGTNVGSYGPALGDEPAEQRYALAPAVSDGTC
jgi:hypothetical protein